MKRVIGLTGGIGSGKSTVSALLSELGATIICADTIGRHVLDRDSEAYREVIDKFGSEYLDGLGNIDRRRLAQFVFSNPDALKKLNAITHPRITLEVKKRINEVRGVMVIDAALLIEVGLHALADEVWLVVADRDIRLKRTAARDGLTFAEIEDRMAAQGTDEEKLKIADRVIDNSGDLESLKRTVKKYYGEFNEEKGK